MRKTNGFVFMETIVVLSVLSVTLLLLFGSFNYLLKVSKTESNFDTTEMIYKTYYTKQIMEAKSTTVKNYCYTHQISAGRECESIPIDDSVAYICDLNRTGVSQDLYTLKTSFEVDKVYLVNPKKILTSANKTNLLLKFDATTIDYINTLGIGADHDYLIVKVKKTYGKTDGSYEIFHSSMEV